MLFSFYLERRGFLNVIGLSITFDVKEKCSTDFKYDKVFISLYKFFHLDLRHLNKYVMYEILYIKLLLLYIYIDRKLIHQSIWLCSFLEADIRNN